MQFFVIARLNYFLRALPFLNLTEVFDLQSGIFCGMFKVN